MSVFLCGECKEEYNRLSRRPVSLPCGHVSCEACLLKRKKGDSVICSTDGRESVFSGLPFCIQILKNLPSIKETEVACPIHPFKKARGYCLEDKSFLCSICVKEHKMSKHTVDLIESSSFSLKKEAQTLTQRLESEWKDVNS